MACRKSRAVSSSYSLNEVDAAVAKAMILRGDRQHDIAAWFGVNGGRIAELSSGKIFSWVRPARNVELPPPGPYPRLADTVAALEAIAQAEMALLRARQLVTSKS